MIGWCLTLAMLTADPPAGPAAKSAVAPMLPMGTPENRLAIQAIQIPDENLVDQIRRYLPGQAQSMSPTTFADLLERYRHSRRQGQERQPVEGRLRASIDPISGLLKGTSTWVVPSSTGPRIAFHPWNLLVRSVQSVPADSLTPTVWGATEQSALVIVPSSPLAQGLEIGWEQQGARRRNGFDFRLRLPTNSLHSLELTIPPNWSLMSPGVVSAISAREHLLLPDSTGTLAFSLTSAESRSSAVAVTSGIARIESTVTPTRIDVRARMEITRIGSSENGIRLTIRVPEGELRPKVDQPGDWTLISRDSDQSKWLFVPSGMSTDRVVLDFAGEFAPPAEGTPADTLWEPPFIRLDDGELLSEEIIFVVPTAYRLARLSPGSFRFEATSTDEAGSLRFAFRGMDRSKRPSMEVIRRRTPMLAQGGMKLDLSANPPRVTGTFELTLDEGQRDSIEAELPAQWRLVSAKLDGATTLTSVRTDVRQDGGQVAFLPLPRMLTPAAPATLEIVAEREGLASPAAAEESLVLPEIRLMDAHVRSTQEYRLLLDPQFPVSLDQLPAPRQTSTDPASPSKPQYVFDFLSPLPATSITLLPALPRFRASLDHQIRWRQSDWRQEWSLDLDIQQGSLETLHLVSPRPLPENLTWRTFESENAVVEFERFPEVLASENPSLLQPRGDQAPDEEPEPGANPKVEREHHYQLRLAFPVRKSIRLQTEWNDTGESIEPPLLRLPDAEDFSAQVQIESRTGRVVDVQSRGLVSTNPFQGDDDAETLVVWKGQYDPLERQASLRLSVQDDKVSLAPRRGRAIVRCVSRLEEESVVHSIEIVMENQHVSPLQVRLPDGAYVWQVMLDGASLQPGQRGGILQIASTLEPGVHSCRLVFSSPLKRFWGLLHVALPTPLEEWDLISSTWMIDRDSGAYLLADRSLKLMSVLQTIERGPANHLVSLTDSPASRETLLRFQNAFTDLPEPVRTSTPDVLRELARTLVPGATLAVSRRSIASRPADTGSAELLGDWLSARGIWIGALDSSAIITKRSPSFLGGEMRRNWNWERWSQQILSEVRANGSSDDQQFLAAVPEPASLLAMPLHDIETGATRQVSWSYVVSGPSQGLAYDVLLVPSDLLTRLSRVGVIVALALTFLFGRHWNIAAHRRFLIGALLASLVVASVGSWAHHLFSVPLWTAVASSVGLLLLRMFRPTVHQPNVGPSPDNSSSGFPAFRSGMLTTLLGILMSPLSMASGAEPGDDRVLIPVSPTGEVKQVIVSDDLARRLQQAGPSPDRVLIERSEYRGEPTVAGKYRWKAVFVGSALMETEQRRVTLALAGIEPLRLVINGKEVEDYHPAGPQTSIDFILPAEQGSSSTSFRAEVEFDSPVVGRAGERSLQFRVPPASVTDVRVGMDQEVILDEASRAEGWQATTIDGKHILARESGATEQVSVRWRVAGEGPPASSPIDFESIRLLKVAGSSVEMSIILRLTVSPDRHEVVIPISDRFVLRELEGEGIRDWHLELLGQKQRVIHVEIEPGQKIRQVSIRGEVAIDPAGPFVMPAIRVEESGRESGVLGLVTGPDWEASIVDRQACRPTTESDFLATWSRLSREVPPASVKETLRVERMESQPPVAVTIELRPRQGKWSIEQDINARLEPVWKTTLIEAKIRAKKSDLPLGPLVLELPAEARVIRVGGPSVKDWIEQGDELEIFLRDSKNESTKEPAIVELTIHLPWDLSSRRAVGRTTRSLAPLRWRQADSPITRWQVSTASGWELAMSDSSATDPVTRGSASINKQVIGTDPIAIQIAPEARELSAETLTRVTIRDRQTVIEGIIQLHVDRGTIGKLEFRSKGGLRNLQWESDQSIPPTAEERGGERVWVHRAGRSVAGDMTLRWRTSKLDDASGTTIPRIILDVPARVREWVSVVNLTGRKIDLQSPGLLANPLPPIFSTLVSGVLGTALPNAQSFLAESKDWQLSFSLDKQKSASPSFLVTWSDHDLLVGEQGSIRGRSVWQIIDQSEGIIEIQTPTNLQCDMISFDENPLTAVERNARGLRLPVFLKGRSQRLVLEWSMTPLKSGDELALPTVLSSAPHPGILRVRHSSASSLLIAPRDGINKIDWLVDRLSHVVEDVTARSRRPFRPSDRLSMLQDLALTRDGQNVLRSLIRANSSSPGKENSESSSADQPLADRATELMRQRDLLEASLRGKGPADGPEVTVPESFLLWQASETVPTTDVHYGRFNGSTISLPVASQTRIEARLLTTNEWVRIAVSAMTLVLVLVYRLWTSMRLYWPAPMVTAAVAWIFFADSPAIGVGLLIIATLGAVRAVSRWLESSVVDYVSTVLIRPERVADSTVARSKP
ncbi:hypothetical protein K2X85_17770 [bacterium]|nr:hypothetical protein [bacterium]